RAAAADVLALTGTGANGALTLTNADALNLLPLTAIGSTPVTYTVATFASRTGSFDAVLINGLATQSTDPAAANYALVAYNATNIQVTVANATAVPEPGTVGVLAAAAGAGLLARRRRRGGR
ncbi:MAG TPA: PEP-CTERM sorting domain-containing protein, partial [Humisphaera sp.]